MSWVNSDAATVLAWALAGTMVILAFAQADAMTPPKCKATTLGGKPAVVCAEHEDIQAGTYVLVDGGGR